MSGLRERQKAGRERRIVEAAAHLFRNASYDAVKIETIAECAEVSAGTIYNYYKNKGDLLVAIVSLEVHEVLNAGEAVIANPPREVEKAVDRLFAIYLEHSLVYLSKAMWRDAMAISTQQPDSPSGVLYAELDRRLASQVCALIRKLQELGSVRSEIDSIAVGQMLFNNMNMMFTVFVKTESMSLRKLRSAVARQSRPLLRAIATSSPR
jgi:AcrR family transcriptional regulator